MGLRPAPLPPSPPLPRLVPSRHHPQAPPASPAELYIELSALPGGSFRRPQHELKRDSQLWVSFGPLRTVKGRTPTTSGDHVPHGAAQRVRVSTHKPDFVSGVGLGLSSPRSSQSEHSGASMDAAVVRARGKDEHAAAAMAGTFIVTPSHTPPQFDVY